MQVEPTMRDVMDGINHLTSDMEVVKANVGGLTSEVAGLTTKVNSLASKMEERFEEVIDAMQVFSREVDDKFEIVFSDMGNLKSDVKLLKSEMVSVKSQMVTKDYLDRKVGEVRGDLVNLMRREDAKVEALVHGLKEERALSGQKATEILSMGPFPG